MTTVKASHRTHVKCISSRKSWMALHSHPPEQYSWGNSTIAGHLRDLIPKIAIILHKFLCMSQGNTTFASLIIQHFTLIIMKRYLLFLIAAFATLVASAHDFEVDGIYYNITSEPEKRVEVTHKGDRYNSHSNEYFGSVTIPAAITYNGVAYSVTSIGYDAFCGCTNLTSITLPASVTSIEGAAFYGCSFTAITLPASVTSIGERAFRECGKLTTINIPENSQLTSIGGYAFINCTKVRLLS